jgi:hypothetical protein
MIFSSDTSFCLNTYNDKEIISFSRHILFESLITEKIPFSTKQNAPDI